MSDDSKKSLHAASQAPRLTKVPDIESRVDSYLANYGKPPREAVRAILDPSDENIRALLQRQADTLATAAYVAERMTELRQRVKATGPDSNPAEPSRGSRYQKMRVRLYERAGDSESALALTSLESLARAHPALQIEVALVGEATSIEREREIQRIPLALRATFVGSADCDSDSLPFIRLEDLSSGNGIEVDARDASAEDLAVLLNEMRPAGPGLGDGGGSTPLSEP